MATGINSSEVLRDGIPPLVAPSEIIGGSTVSRAWGSLRTLAVGDVPRGWTDRIAPSLAAGRAAQMHAGGLRVERAWLMAELCRTLLRAGRFGLARSYLQGTGSVRLSPQQVTPLPLPFEPRRGMGPAVSASSALRSG